MNNITNGIGSSLPLIELAQIENSAFFVPHFATLLSPQDLARLDSTCRIFHGLRTDFQTQRREEYKAEINRLTDFLRFLQIDASKTEILKTEMTQAVSQWSLTGESIQDAFSRFFESLDDSDFNRLKNSPPPFGSLGRIRAKWHTALKFEEVFRETRDRDEIPPEGLEKIARALVQGHLLEEAITVVLEHPFCVWYEGLTKRILTDILQELATTEDFTYKNVFRVASHLRDVHTEYSRSFKQSELLYKCIEAHAVSKTLNREVACRIVSEIPATPYRRAAFCKLLKGLAARGHLDLEIFQLIIALNEHRFPWDPNRYEEEFFPYGPVLEEAIINYLNNDQVDLNIVFTAISLMPDKREQSVVLNSLIANLPQTKHCTPKIKAFFLSQREEIRASY